MAKTCSRTRRSGNLATPTVICLRKFITYSNGDLFTSSCKKQDIINNNRIVHTHKNNQPDWQFFAQIKAADTHRAHDFRGAQA